jgi:hypothetical protein
MAINRLSNNVGGVKRFSGTPQQALEGARHFAAGTEGVYHNKGIWLGFSRYSA